MFKIQILFRDCFFAPPSTPRAILNAVTSRSLVASTAKLPIAFLGKIVVVLIFCRLEPSLRLAHPSHDGRIEKRRIKSSVFCRYQVVEPATVRV